MSDLEPRGDHPHSSDTACDKINGLVQNNVNISTSIRKLEEEKAKLQAKLKSVEGSLLTNSRNKENLLGLSEKLKRWADKIKSANRNNQGVPYVREIKVVCNEILTEINKEDFQKRYTSLLESDIPCITLVSDGMKALENVCCKVLQNEANYNAIWVEEMRQLIGRLSGCTNAILSLHFEE